ncbi:MAG: exopolysaccharide biosynthesis protein [Fimbriimonadales bacterium]|nr:exopolysaccharide biosynthesis protein [Fimbriimonadales bacterium]
MARPRMSHSQERLSELFLGVLDTDADGTVSVDEVLQRAGDRGYGFLLILLAIPAFIPVLPPGTSTILGLLMSLIALQMLWGRAVPWLPARWRRHRLAPQTVMALQTRGVAILRQLERISRPRGRWLVRNGFMLRWHALLVIFMALVLSSPLPFLNTLPALGVLLIGIGLMNHDAYFLAAGNLIALVLAFLVGTSFHLLVEAVRRVLML